LRYTAWFAVRFLDNDIEGALASAADLRDRPSQRKIGLGVMGFAELPMPLAFPMQAIGP
jgi:ribonucleotide reductase alpha subunit